MMYCTPTETHKSRKVRLCDSCGERVLVGEPYVRWRCYDSGDAGSVQMHPECYAMHCAEAGNHQWEFYHYSHERPVKGEA